MLAGKAHQNARQPNKAFAYVDFVCMFSQINNSIHNLRTDHAQSRKIIVVSEAIDHITTFLFLNYNSDFLNMAAQLEISILVTITDYF